MYCVKVRVSLSQYKLPLAVVFQFSLSALQGKVLLSPVLEFQRLVDFQSAGFKAMYNFGSGRAKLEDVRGTFMKLQQTDRAFRNHINPDGETYIDVGESSVTETSLTS
jgi:hypothetical protein